MQISHVLVFQGEVPEVVLCPSLEEVKKRIYEAFQFQPKEIESFDRDLDSDDSWTFDEVGDRFCFSTGIGEIETVIIYTVKQQPSPDVTRLAPVEGGAAQFSPQDEDRGSMLLAERIVDHLFKNGQGQQAQRLVLELAGSRDGGGWGRASVRDVIERELGLYEELRQAASVFLKRPVTEEDNKRMVKALLALDNAGEFGEFDDATKEYIEKL